MNSEPSSTGNVIPVTIEDELKTSYLTYAMSVIVSRALPDVRDGLKPVHRRILFAMKEMGLRANQAPKKSGRVVGDVLGKFHPHGEQSIYDALVRLAQDFSLRYPVIQGQGNFGSVDGDPPAAMRYTEVRLHQRAELIVEDLGKETVDFRANYDDSLTEPEVLPGSFPFLLANGASGIAVGMMTNIPSHNLREVVQAIQAVIENPSITTQELLKYVKGPDFATGGIVQGVQNLKKAYETGQGSLILRARVETEEHAGKTSIVITEIPYQVNKSELLKQIAKKMQGKSLEGISKIRDESDRSGIRMVLELQRGTNSSIVLNQLFKHSNLQITFPIRFLALVNGLPRLLSLKEIISEFIKHRYTVVVRRAEYELRKARELAHVLEGFAKAIENIERVVSIIRSSPDTPTASQMLMAEFLFSEKQTKAILDLRLYRISNLETEKILRDLERVRAEIDALTTLLGSKENIFEKISKNVEEIAKTFGDDRRTSIVHDEVSDLQDEDLLQEQSVVVLFSREGYIKRVPLDTYRTQSRGGKGIFSSSRLHRDDFIMQVLSTTTHSYLFFMTTLGKMYWIKIYSLSEFTREARGSHISSILALQQDETIASLFSIPDMDDSRLSLVFATKRGIIKRLSLTDVAKSGRRGVLAIRVLEGDSIVGAALIDPEHDVFMVSRRGKALRINNKQVRVMGRTAQGVRGMRLSNQDGVVSVSGVNDQHEVVIVTEHGFGKRVRISDFSVHGRGTGGQIAYKIQEEQTGMIINATPMAKDDSCIIVTNAGKTLRLQVSKIAMQGRTSRGVRVITMDNDDAVQVFAQVPPLLL